MSDQTTARRYLALVLAGTTILFLLPALLVLIIDPYQVYHRHWSEKPQFLPLERYQNAGLINSYLDEGSPYAGLILGSSLSQNFRPSTLAAKLDWGPTLHLTMRKAAPKELRIVAERALRHAPIRDVLWEIHPDFFLDPDATSLDTGIFPKHLYTDSVLDDIPYVFSNDMVKRALRVVRGKFTTDIDGRSYWMDDALAAGTFQRYSSADNLALYRSDLRDHRAGMGKPADPVTGGGFPNVDVNLLPILRAHPKVRFVLYVPPVNILFYAMMPPARFQRSLALRRHLVAALADLPNVRLFAFDDLAWITGNLAYYQDMDHFPLAINRYMTKAFREDRHRLSAETLEVYERAFRQHVETYDVTSTPVDLKSPPF